MNQISNFEAKVANGNGEQTLCRDVYRLGHRFDFYRMLSMYFTTVGFYFNSMVWISCFHISTLYALPGGKQSDWFTLWVYNNRPDIDSSVLIPQRSYLQIVLLLKSVATVVTCFITIDINILTWAYVDAHKTMLHHASMFSYLCILFVWDDLYKALSPHMDWCFYFSSNGQHIESMMCSVQST
jgi:hypothetical protein